MISESRSVALVGKPNVGKSRLFNRLVGRRVSIVHDEPGITRDVVAEEVGTFTLMDTGGIGMKPTQMSPKEMNTATEDQVDFALQAASVVVFVVDGLTEPTAQDEYIAAMLRRYGKRTILAVNKIDNPDTVDAGHLDVYYRLGFDEVLAVSAEHGHGAHDLLDKIEESLPEAPEVEEAEGSELKPIRICFTGRPNVGKSSLSNALLKEDRLIVSDIPGTTRDSVSARLEYAASEDETWHFELVDTAGLRKTTKVDSSVEFFSSLRTEESILYTDVAFLVVDALEGVTKQDKKMAGAVLKTGRALGIIVNKWDYAMKQFSKENIIGYEGLDDFKKTFEAGIRKELFFLPKSPIIFTSATKNYSLDAILKVAKALNERVKRKLPTSKLNSRIIELMEKQKPPVVLGKRFKAYYSVQVSNDPFLFKIFCNKEVRLDDRYRRYLQSGLIHAFNLDGCPIEFELIGKPARFSGSNDS